MKTIYIIISCILCSCNKPHLEEIPQEQPKIEARLSNNYGYHLKIDADKKCHWRDTDSIFPIIQSDSPEGRLKWMNYAELDSLVKYGINTITATLRTGGDVSGISPYRSATYAGVPTSGFDHAKLQQWRNYFLHFAQLTHGRYLLILYMSEKENHFNLNQSQNYQLIDTMYEWFGDLSVMWQREEMTNNTSFINTYVAYEKQKDQLNLISLHDNTDDVSVFNYSFVDIAGLQTSLGNENNKVNQIHGMGKAVYAHERTGGFSNTDTNSVKQWAANTNLAGAGIYIGSYDTQQPTSQTAYSHRLLYKSLAKALNGTGDVVIPPTTVSLVYSTSASRSNPIAFPMTSTGNYYVFLQGVTTSNQSGWNFMLYKNGVQVLSHSENSIPIDMVSSSPTFYTFTSGTWRLVVTRNGVQFDKTFTL